jgi:ElaB/YqjD/DUF883 family membrane-anchored ribosome-binding protein
MGFWKRFWAFLRNETTLDEKVIEVVNDAKEDVAELRERAKKVVKEAKEVGAAVKKVVEESKDVVEAVKPARKRKPRTKKYTPKK